MKIVGILGGMGPDATVDLMRRVIQGTPAGDDSDHIRMLVDNNPKVPSRIKALIEGTGESPAPCLVEMAKGLERQGADFLVMPCNTAHYYFDDVARAVSIPFVNLPGLAVDAAVAAVAGLQKVGMLASTAVSITSLYRDRFQDQGIEAIFPGDALQQEVMNLIREVKAGTAGEEDLAAMNRAAEALEGCGSQCLIIACTELSVVSGGLVSRIPVLDTAQVLADYIVRAARA